MDWFNKNSKGRFESVSLKHINVQRIKPKFDRKKAPNFFNRSRKQVPSVMLPTPEAHARRLGQEMPPAKAGPPAGRYESVSLNEVSIEDATNTFQSDNPMFNKNDTTTTNQEVEPISTLPTPENFQNKMKLYKQKENAETELAKTNATKYRMSVSALFFNSARKLKEKATSNNDLSFRGKNKNIEMECSNPMFAGNSEIIEETNRMSEIPTIPVMDSYAILSDVEEGESEAEMSEAEAESGSESEAEAEMSEAEDQFSESEAESESESEAESEAEAEMSEAENHVSESEAESGSESEAESEAEAEMSEAENHVSESEAESGSESEAESEAESEMSEAEDQFSESEAESGSESEAESEMFEAEDQFSESEVDDNASQFSEFDDQSEISDATSFFENENTDYPNIPTPPVPRKKNSLGMRAPSLPPRPPQHMSDGSRGSTFSLESIVNEEEL